MLGCCWISRLYRYQPIFTCWRWQMRGREDVQFSKVQLSVLYNIVSLMPININALFVRLCTKPKVVQPLDGCAWLYLLWASWWEFSTRKKVAVDPRTKLCSSHVRRAFGHCIGVNPLCSFVAQTFIVQNEETACFPCLDSVKSCRHVRMVFSL